MLLTPPGNFCIQGDSPLNRFSESLVLNNISPIQTNNGRAVRVQEDDIPQIVVAIASPTGLEVNNSIAMAETPIMLKATHTPLLRNNNKTVIKKIANIISVIFKSFKKMM